MLICGIKGTSLIDYPGKVAAVIYTNNCNFRCPFCHNAQLALGKETTIVTQEEIIKTISARKGFIDGIVITGGEPTLQTDLEDFIREIKKTGILIKLDTNGSHPEVMEKLLFSKSLDYIAMDIKTSWKKYNSATGVKTDAGRLIWSVELIKQSGIDSEFRTTCVPGLVDEQDILEISKMIGRHSSFTIQQFQPRNTLDMEYTKIKPYPREKLLRFAEIVSPNAGSCRILGI